MSRSITYMFFNAQAARGGVRRTGIDATRANRDDAGAAQSRDRASTLLRV
jgi:hypothetical protein